MILSGLQLNRKSVQNKNLSSNFRSSYFLMNQDKVSFQKAKEPSEKTMKYIEDVKNFFKNKSLPLKSLDYFDLTRMMDICAGIPVFEGWSAVDLKHATDNMDSILLSRGCYKQCAHCGANALPKISFMKWENFTDLVDGMATLKDRLGFNLFHLRYGNFIYPFHDSDPVDYRQVDDKGQLHTIYDAANYFYEKTGSKFAMTTAGWAPENAVVQQAMQKIVENPKIIQGLMISVHPFHRFITRSNELKEQGNLAKAQEYRERYVDMMANVIKTLAPLRKKSQFLIKIEYENSFEPKAYESAKQLFVDILNKIKLTDPTFCFLDKNETFDDLLKKNIVAVKEIKNEGRTKNLIDKAMNLFNNPGKPIPMVTKDNFGISKKYIDVNGSILATHNNTNLEAQFVALPKKLNFSKPTIMDDKYNYPTLDLSELVYQPLMLAENVYKDSSS